MTAIREKIEEHLAQIEDTYHVTILFACESGSRAWGFESPDSDYDVRFIYVHRLDWYLRVSPQRDVIELPINDLLDINGWELRKALGLLKKGNATLLEWLQSPIVYHKRRYFEKRMRLEAIAQCYQPERAFYHYLHMAQRNYREYLQGDQVRLKKYLYVLRPIFAARWIEQHNTFPPIVFETLFQHMVNEAMPTHHIVRLLLQQKMQALETEYTSKILALNDYISAELARLSKVKLANNTSNNDGILDNIFNDMVTRFQHMSQQDDRMIPSGYDCCDHHTICPYWQEIDEKTVRCNYMNLTETDGWALSDLLKQCDIRLYDENNSDTTNA